MTPTLSTLGFHHVTMVSTDARRTLAFYRDLLGMDLVKQTVNFDDPGAYHLYFGRSPGRPGTLLTFFEWPGSRRGQWGVGGVHHVALGVETPEAQLKWKRRLTDAGVPVSGPLDRGYFRSIYFADPDGQILEIATRGPGYAIDEPVGELGRRLVTPPTERLPGGRDEASIHAAIHPEPVPELTPDMTLYAIHHVTAITDDLERAHDFYADALGLSLVKRTLNQDDGRTEHWFWAHVDGASVGPSWTLFGWPGSRQLARPGAGQTHHVAFRARDDDEQRAWLDHLRARGIEVTDILDRSYFRSLYFRAPDGVLLEIATDGPGFAIDEEEDALGRALRLPPWLERRRPEVEAALAPLPLPAGAPAGTSAADGDPAADDRPGREERTR
jgi:glyoxalase family protein